MRLSGVAISAESKGAAETERAGERTMQMAAQVERNFLII
jgi:hypothetical protein